MKSLQKIFTVSLFVLLFCMLAACSRNQNPIIVIETDYGNIEAELFLREAPISAGNFLYHIDSGTFSTYQPVFYRVVRLDNQPDNDIKIEVVQGGLHRNNRRGVVTPIEHETTQATGVKHTHGVLSMARNAPGTATVEFSICVNDQPELDFGGKRNPDGQGFAAFGKVIKGMEIVIEIQQFPDERQYLLEPVPIRAIRRK